MSASANPGRPALIRVGTLLDALTRRVRSPAEQASHAKLQAEAERALHALLTSLGDLDEQPIQLAIRALSQDPGAE
jgi:hypothetical protein